MLFLNRWGKPPTDLYSIDSAVSPAHFALLNELDITVQCQIDVFVWLLKYITEQTPPTLDFKNVSSILVSADSLIMKDVVEEWLLYIKNNLEQIVNSNVNIPPFKSHLAKQLAKIVPVSALSQIGDQKNYLTSRLYKKKLEIYFEESSNLLTRCVIWNELYTKSQAELIPCPNSDKIFVNYKGELTHQHGLEDSFDLNEYVMNLREKKLQWRHIYYQVCLHP